MKLKVLFGLKKITVTVMMLVAPWAELWLSPILPYHIDPIPQWLDSPPLLRDLETEALRC